MVGDPGVGKTAIAEGLAWLIVNGKAPKPLANATIYSLDMGALIAGTKFRGEFETRMKDLIDELKDTPESILFIDEIHMMIGAGASMDSSMDVSNLIKPALLPRGIFAQLALQHLLSIAKFLKKISTISAFLEKIDIKEPSVSDTIAILQGLKGILRRFSWRGIHRRCH